MNTRQHHTRDLKN